ncbi:hypothetical protein EDB85DRAFT_2017427 [Lactarius pseudohatsudake]|nr:hypothetical protein EDB85DRAFT_2017427 [Lactarius pseudohatsudake]
MKKICRIYWRRSTRSISTVLHPHKSTAQTIMHHVQSQASGTSAVVQPNPFSGQIPANDRSSYASSTTVVEDRHDGSPAQEDGFRGVSPVPNNHRGEIPNLYSTPYPLLPSQIGPRGAIAHPFSASFLPTLSPSAGSTDQVSPGIPTIQHPLPYATIINTATRRCTIPQGGIPGRPRCRHHRRHQECFLPLRTDGSVLLPVTRSILAPLPPRQFMRDNEPPIFSGTPTPAVRRILVLPLRPSQASSGNSS